MIRLFCMLLYAFLIFSPALALGQEDGTAPDAYLQRLKVLAILEDDENAMRKAVRAKLEDMEAELQELTGTYREIVLSLGIAGTTPMVLREFYAQLARVNDRSSDILTSLKNLQSQVEARLESLNNATGSVDDKEIQDAATTVDKNYIAYTQTLTRLKTALKEQAVNIKGKMGVAEKLEKRSSLLIKRMEKELPSKWEGYFIVGKNPPFSEQFWDNAVPFTRWVALRFPLWAERFSVAEKGATNALLFFVAFFSLLFGAAVLAGRRIFFEEEYRSERPKFVRACAVIILGMTILVTKEHFYPKFTGIMYMVGISIVGFGSMWVSHIIRCTFCEYAYPSRTPLTWLFAAGGVILVTGMPEQVVIPVWIVLGVLVSGVMKNRLVQHSILLRQTFWFWMLLLTFGVAIFGYGRLAILLGMILFTGYYVYTIARAGTCLASFGISHLPDQGFYPFLRALLMGIFAPIIWAASVLLAFIWIYDFFGAAILEKTVQINIGWKGFTLHFFSIIFVVAFFFLTRAAIAVVNTYIKRTGRKWPRGKRGTLHSLQSISTYTFWALFALLSLGALGVNLTSLTVIAGGLSVGIGFGMQAIFNNFISGLILLFGRSIQQEDIIQMGNVLCTVKKINIRTTVVETFENAAIIIPNSDLISNQVTNWTKDSAVLRKQLTVGVAYGSDAKLVEKTLIKIAEEHPRVLSEPAPWVEFNNFGSSSLDFILRVWIDDIDYTLRTMSDLRFSIDDAFSELGIEIAFPQMDVHIRSADGLPVTEAPAES